MSETELVALVKSIQELREGNRELREMHQEMQRENEKRQRENEKRQHEWQRESREMRRETDRVIREMAGEWSSRWGQLVEALIEPGLVKQFRDRGFNITQSAQRVEGMDASGKQIEIDVLLVDGDTVVAIEVKSKCKVEDIEEHEDRLARFKEAFLQYANKKVIGGIAAITYDSDCHRYAFKRGLFAIKPTKGVAHILNNAAFCPKEF
jgi:hypothetical protein